MGQDKAETRITENSPTLLELVIDRVGELSQDCFIVNRSGQKYPGIDLRVVADAYGDIGVLGGMATAIQSARFPRVIIVACDMPFLNSSLLAFIRDFPADTDVVVPTLNLPSIAQKTQRTYQSLHARYSKRCLSAMEKSIAKGDLRTMSFYSDVVVTSIRESRSRSFDSNLDTFWSINDLPALKRARSLYTSTKSKSVSET